MDSTEKDVFSMTVVELLQQLRRDSQEAVLYIGADGDVGEAMIRFFECHTDRCVATKILPVLP